MYTAICTGSVEAAVDLGMDIYKIAKAGWNPQKKMWTSYFRTWRKFWAVFCRTPLSSSSFWTTPASWDWARGGASLISDGQLRGMMAFMFRGASRRTGQSHQTCPGSAEEGGGSLRLASLCIPSHHDLGLWGIHAAANLSTQRTSRNLTSWRQSWRTWESCEASGFDWIEE
jgi:hypothetical protein